MQSLTLDDEHAEVSDAIHELITRNNILTRFSHELLDDPGDAIVEFHFGCGADRIEWDDKDFSHMEFAPPVIISLDLEELGEGRFNAMTPEGIAGLLFRGRHRRRVNEHLLNALELERERVRHGLDSEVNVAEIRTCMNKVRNAVLASFRAAR